MHHDVLVCLIHWIENFGPSWFMIKTACMEQEQEACACVISHAHMRGMESVSAASSACMRTDVICATGSVCLCIICVECTVR